MKRMWKMRRKVKHSRNFASFFSAKYAHGVLKTDAGTPEVEKK
jgi:hypothetical protein